MHTNRLTNLKRCGVVFLLLFGLSSPIKSEIIIVVNSIPHYTPIQDTIFLAGTFNNWTAEDPEFMMRKQKDGSFVYVFKEDIAAFEYKFTRGGWHAVEGNKDGYGRDNRYFVYDENTENIVVTNIQSWVDLAILEKPQLTILLEVPASTPHDASIYLAGNFNTWNPQDPEYKFDKILAGTYLLKLPPGLDTFQCKITRGNWESVEGRANGKARKNRQIALLKDQSTDLKMTVESWEDLSYPLSIYSMIMLFAVFQGLLLIITLYSIQNNNRQANRYLSILIALVSLSLFTKIAAYDRDIFQNYPKILLVPEFIFFLYAPLFHHYIQKLITNKKKNSFWFWISFVPFLIFILANLPYFNMDNQTFINREVDSDFDFFFSVIGACGLAYNGFFWLRFKKLVQYIAKSSDDSHSFEQNLTYLKTVLILLSVCLLLWLSVYLVGFYGVMAEKEVLWIVETLTDSVWLFFASINFILGYFAINQPEIFKIAEIEKYKDSNLSTTDIEQMKTTLERTMQNEKAYVNSQLTLAELSKMIHTNTHTLSRVINDGFGKNFFDFVNEYRVNHFIHAAESSENCEKSFLALAHSAGFNSKSSFNRAFKKAKGVAPREYLQGD